MVMAVGGRRQSASLEIEGVTLAFGGLEVLRGVSLDIRPAEVLGLIGPNGAGKTSLLNCISGFYRPDRGEIRLGSIRVDQLRPHQRMEVGLGRTFQEPLLVPEESALANVLLGTYGTDRYSIVQGVLRTRAAGGTEARAAARCLAVLESLGVGEADALRTVAELPYGTRKRVEVARVLVGDPLFVFIDEPAAGLRPDEIRGIGDQLRSIARRGIGVVVIDHNVRFVRSVADRIVAMASGEVIADGPPDSVIADAEVRRVYLGDWR